MSPDIILRKLRESHICRSTYNNASVDHALGDPLEVLLVLVDAQVVVRAAHHHQPAPRAHPLPHVLHVVRPTLGGNLGKIFLEWSHGIQRFIG